MVNEGQSLGVGKGSGPQSRAAEGAVLPVKRGESKVNIGVLNRPLSRTLLNCRFPVSFSMGKTPPRICRRLLRFKDVTDGYGNTSSLAGL